MEDRNTWIDIITKLYTHLHESDRVMHVSKESDKKRERIIKYFERLEEIHNLVSSRKNKAAEKALKKYYYNLYVIKPENIPEAYFENEIKRNRNMGLDEPENIDEMKQNFIKQIICDQKNSLDGWIEYFLYDEESKSYEIWEKYWVFQGLQKLGKYDKETYKFSKRDKSTIYPFPEVNKEAIFTTLKLMEEYIKDKKSEKEIKDALGSGNFKTLYEYSVKMILKKDEKKVISNKGTWIKFEQGTDYNKLRDSLQGYYTGWCTAAGENFAKNQIATGDFYVFYSLDENNEPKVPRIAIRMEGKKRILEIRGIADDQNLEPEMIPILEEKLKEFPGKDEYLKKDHDMRMIVKINDKLKNNEELSLEELKFLYEVDNKIEGFGYEKDSRIKQILDSRNKSKDLMLIFNCREDEIGFYENDLNKKLKIYYGDLNVRVAEKGRVLNFPKIVIGNLYLGGLITPEGLTLPEKIIGNLYLGGLKTAKNLKLPKIIIGDLNLGSLASAEYLNLPEIINGSLNLRSLRTSKNLKLPRILNGDLFLAGLKTTEGLILPEILTGNLNLSGLEKADSLKLPEVLNGDLDLNNVKKTNNLKLPKKINGSLILASLESAEGLKLPEELNGYLYLNSLKSAQGLKLPELLNDGLNLNGLKTADNLKLPKIINGSLILNSLITAKNLILPEIISGDLYLSALTSTEDLKLPKTVNGDLVLDSLEELDGLMLPNTINGYLYLNGLKTAQGLKLPYNFNLEKLICNNEIKKEIENNPEKYFRKEEKELQKNVNITSMVGNVNDLNPEGVIEEENEYIR